MNTLLGKAARLWPVNGLPFSFGNIVLLATFCHRAAEITAIFFSEGGPAARLAVARFAVAAHSGSLLGLSSFATGRRPISQGVMVQLGISGRVLNTVEIAPRCNIAICEFGVSFRGAPAY